MNEVGEGLFVFLFDKDNQFQLYFWQENFKLTFMESFL